MFEIKNKSISLINGEKYAYGEIGQGPTILFLHGNMSSRIFWEKRMKKLGLNFQCLAPDLRGFGDSTYRTKIHSLWDYVEDLKDFIEGLGLQKIHLVGWSLGGAVALGLAARYEKFFVDMTILGGLGLADPKEKLVWKLPGFDDVLAGPWPKGLVSKDPLLAYGIDMLWQSTMYNVKEPGPKEKEDYLQASLKQVNRRDVILALRDFQLSQKDWAKIQLPTLFLHGRQDRVVPYHAQSRRTRNCRVQVLENCGHFIMNDDFDQYIRLMKDFFSHKEYR